MAHHASAQKHMRQSLKRRARNRRNLSRLKSQIKRLRAAVKTGGDSARQLLPATAAEIDKAVKKGVIHRNAGRRYKSRLSARVSALPAAKA